MPDFLDKLQQAQGLKPPSDDPDDFLSKLQKQSGILPGQSAQGVQSAPIQPLTPEQTARLAESRQQRQAQQEYERQQALQRYGVASRFETEPTREEVLLQQGIETGGEPLRLSRLAASFATNPVPVIQQGLLDQYPEVDPSQLNLRYITRGDEKDIQKQMDNAVDIAHSKAQREIKDRETGGEIIDEALRQKITDRHTQKALTDMPGLELVYNDPETGRITVANPTGADLGDLGELLGPSLPFLGEMIGAGGGAIAGGVATQNPLGVVAGAGLGGAAGGGLGESMRLGIGRLIGVEPEEEDFISPVLSQSAESGVYSLLGAGLAHMFARTVAKRVASGKFGYESAKLADFIDPVTFRKNKDAVKRMNEIARERGITLTAKPTAGKLAEDPGLLGIESKLATPGGQLEEMGIEQARFLDEIGTAWTPEGEFLRKKKGDLVDNITDYMKRRIQRREKALGSQIDLSEADEMAMQVEKMMTERINPKSSLGMQSLRDVAEEARQRVLRNKYGDEFNRIERAAYGIEGKPQEFAQEAREMLERSSQEVSPTLSPEDKKFIREAAMADQPPEIARPRQQTLTFLDENDELKTLDLTPKMMKTYEGMANTLKNVKELARNADAGRYKNRDARIYHALIDRGEEDLKRMMTDAGRLDLWQDLQKNRAGYEQAYRKFDAGFGKLVEKDKVGNYKVTEPEFFEKAILDRSTAPAVVSMLEEANLLGQLPRIKQGIRDIYSKRFFPEGPKVLTDAQRRMGVKWFKDNEDALNKYFSPEELNEFKSPLAFSKKEIKRRERLAKANEKMRQWFGADLAYADPTEFMTKLQSKMTPKRVKQLKHWLPKEYFDDIKNMYQQDLFSRIRSNAYDQKFDLNNMFSELGEGATPTVRAQMGREVSEAFLGEKTIKDMGQFAQGLRVMYRTANNTDKMQILPREGQALLRLFTGPLSERGRKTRAILSLFGFNVENRMQRAVADPERLLKMTKALKMIDRRGLSEGAATTATNLLFDALGHDLGPITEQVTQAIEEVD